MFVYCLNNPILYVDNTGSRAIKCDISEGVGASIEGLSRIEAAYVLGLDYASNTAYVNALLTKRNDQWKENPNKRKGHDKRQPTGERERNVEHPNGEEHSRVPKGNRGVRRIEATVGIVAASLVIVVLIADDVTCAGVADDGALVPTAMIWWDCAMVLF